MTRFGIILWLAALPLFVAACGQGVGNLRQHKARRSCAGTLPVTA
jgi:hypothetical protein